ncbi:MAG: hypothetical protein JO047_11965 [Alphaproteobacteria bacterium]|nr:hypothetical protein [Alphaproteobacteria bacterium]
MANPRDIVWLGIAAALSGCLVGGVLLAIGIALVLSGTLAGILLVCAGPPVALLIGWLLGRRLAREAG